MSAPSSGLLLLSSADFVQLQQALLDAGAELREVSLAGVRNKGALLARFARALDFPEGIGHNWDSLADALRDVFPPQQAPQVLIVRHCRALREASPEDLQILVDILADTLTFYAGQGQQVAIVLDARPPRC
ncbi:barnase inhibitor [Lysobacteraceae bacterium NML95-0200]|nr:barnase inhibitor [Xanthomonadaceae bacterium NML95-0200]